MLNVSPAAAPLFHLCNMLQNPLPDQRFAFATRQIVLAIPFQQNHLTVFQLVFAIIADASHFHVQRFGWLEIVRQINADPIADRSHVSGQWLGVRVEPLDLGLAKCGLDFIRQSGTELPAHLSDALKAIVQIGEQAAFVALQRFVAELQERNETPVAGGRTGNTALGFDRVFALRFLFDFN